MTSRPLLPALLTAALTLGAMNLAIGAWSHGLKYVHKLETIRTAHNPNLLIVGNSLLDGHLDEAALAQMASQNGIGFIPVNAAMGASLPPEHLLLFDYAVQNHPGIHTLVPTHRAGSLPIIRPHRQSHGGHRPPLSHFRGRRSLWIRPAGPS